MGIIVLLRRGDSDIGMLAGYTLSWMEYRLESRMNFKIFEAEKL